MKNKVSNFFIGFILLIIGSMTFLSNVTVTNNTGGMLSGLMGNLFGSTGKDPKELTGVLFVVMFVTLLIMFIKLNIITVSAFIMSILVMVFSLIAGMKIQVADMSGLEMVIMVGMMIIGLGMVIGSFIQISGAPEKSAETS